MELVEPDEPGRGVGKEDFTIRSTNGGFDSRQRAAEPEPRTEGRKENLVAGGAEVKRGGDESVQPRVELCDGLEDLRAIGLDAQYDGGCDALAVGVGREQAWRDVGYYGDAGREDGGAARDR